jgi:hypothetical protein
MGSREAIVISVRGERDRENHKGTKGTKMKRNMNTTHLASFVLLSIFHNNYKMKPGTQPSKFSRASIDRSLFVKKEFTSIDMKSLSNAWMEAVQQAILHCTWQPGQETDLLPEQFTRAAGLRLRSDLSAGGFETPSWDHIVCA